MIFGKSAPNSSTPNLLGPLVASQNPVVHKIPPKMDGKTGQRTRNLEVNQFVCDDDDDDDDKPILEKRCWKCVKKSNSS